MEESVVSQSFWSAVYKTETLCTAKVFAKVLEVFRKIKRI